MQTIGLGFLPSPEANVKVLSLVLFFTFLTSAGLASENVFDSSTNQILTCPDFLTDKDLNWSGKPDNHRLPPNFLNSSLDIQNFKYMKQLPKNISSPEATAFFQGAFTLLRDHSRVYKLLQQLKEEQKHDSIENIYAKYENQFGFKVMGLDDIAPDRTWLAYIANGFVLIDSKALYTYHSSVRLGHFRHGPNAHRLQLHLILRELVAHPEKFGGPFAPSKVLAIYKTLGTRNAGRDLDWSDTGLDASEVHLLHSELFDTIENNASNPGFFFEYRRYWPWVLI